MTVPRSTRPAIRTAMAVGLRTGGHTRSSVTATFLPSGLLRRRDLKPRCFRRTLAAVKDIRRPRPGSRRITGRDHGARAYVSFSLLGCVRRRLDAREEAIAAICSGSRDAGGTVAHRFLYPKALDDLYYADADVGSTIEQHLEELAAAVRAVQEHGRWRMR